LQAFPLNDHWATGTNRIPGRAELKGAGGRHKSRITTIPIPFLTANVATVKAAIRNRAVLDHEEVGAAYCGNGHHAVTDSVPVEPVCTESDHRRRGLVRAAVLEVARRC